jgi:hypothetical protein
VDPYEALVAGIGGDPDARAAYNRWVRNGGYQVPLKVRKFTKTWNRGIRRINVRKITPTKVIGADAYNEKTKISLPFAALEND